MKVGILSDIHANITALEAVLDDLQQQQVDAVYCLGDLVGYAAFPNEVIDRIRRDGTPTIMGNYDDGVGFDRDECGCAYRDPEEQRLGDLSLRWTQRTVTSDRKEFLRSLGARPSNHRDSHHPSDKGSRSRLTHPGVMRSPMVRPWWPGRAPTTRVRLPTIRRDDTASRCCASCTPATTPLAPS